MISSSHFEDYEPNYSRGEDFDHGSTTRRQRMRTLEQRRRWAAVAAIGAGMLSSYMDSKKKNTTVPNQVTTAYGENTPIQGAITSRDSVLNTLNSRAFNDRVGAAQDQYLSGLQTAATNPAWGQIGNYGQSVLRGDYLQSPVITKYANDAYNRIMAEAADNQTRMQTQFNRAGQGFSTGMAQALQAARTTAAAKAATVKSGILADNYGKERVLQQGASDILQSGIAGQSSAYGNAMNALYAPLQAQAGLTTQLLGNQSVTQPTLIAQPSFADKFASGVNTASGLYSLYNNMNSSSKSGKSAQSVYDAANAEERDTW